MASFCCALSLLFAFAAQAEVHPNPLFSDHAVLQAEREIPVWGTATEGEAVTVSIAGRTAKAITQGGHWKALLPAMKPGGPYVLRIAGSNVIEVQDVLIGEVWLASGQSNMERQLGPRPPQQPLLHWEEDAAKAELPSIREFYVVQTRSLTMREEPVGHWTVCTPKTAPDFSAVGFYFARELWQRRKVPVGVLHSSWGGTPAEAWMSDAALKEWPDFVQALTEAETAQRDSAGSEARLKAAWAKWYATYDQGKTWEDPATADQVWETQALPGYWEGAGLSDFDGVVWYRRSFEVPEAWVNKETELHLGAIDDADTTWINGRQVGGLDGWNTPRIYRIPSGTLHAGSNTIAVRVLDTGGGGGLSGGEGKLRLMLGAGAMVDLDGAWKRKVSVELKNTGPMPRGPLSTSPNFPGALYKGMIAPLLPYAIRGVIWYQGEANVGRETEYRTLFPALIADWRKAWNQDFPFLFVQIAPFSQMTPQIREAQLLALKETKNTAMVVTLDCGDPKDIHPANKQPVGERLAWAARALAYGEKVEHSGPIFESAEISGGKATLRFSHLGDGLVAKGEKGLEGFVIVDAMGQVHPAKAEIQGDTVVASATEVPSPVAVRYAWGNAPTGNLFNRVGFPASPFRTDPPARIKKAVAEQ